jgi:hypothetical protein
MRNRAKKQICQEFFKKLLKNKMSKYIYIFLLVLCCSCNLKKSQKLIDEEVNVNEEINVNKEVNID